MGITRLKGRQTEEAKRAKMEKHDTFEDFYLEDVEIRM